MLELSLIIRKKHFIRANGCKIGLLLQNFSQDVCVRVVVITFLSWGDVWQERDVSGMNVEPRGNVQEKLAFNEVFVLLWLSIIIRQISCLPYQLYRMKIHLKEGALSYNKKS